MSLYFMCCICRKMALKSQPLNLDTKLRVSLKSDPLAVSVTSLVKFFVINCFRSKWREREKLATKTKPKKKVFFCGYPETEWKHVKLVKKMT